MRQQLGEGEERKKRLISSESGPKKNHEPDLLSDDEIDPADFIDPEDFRWQSRGNDAPRG